MASDDNYDIPYVPTSDERLGVMMDFAEIKPGQRTLDLGAGDGRVVIAMAKAGAKAYGIEVDPERARIASGRIDKLELADRASVDNGNFWDHEFGKYDVITVFGIRSVMPGLEKKLLAEAKSDCRIICNYFYFPNLTPKKVKKYVLLYQDINKGKE